jgi:hypothetical protein
MWQQNNKIIFNLEATQMSSAFKIYATDFLDSFTIMREADTHLEQGSLVLLGLRRGGGVFATLVLRLLFLLLLLLLWGWSPLGATISGQKVAEHIQEVQDACTVQVREECLRAEIKRSGYRMQRNLIASFLLTLSS